MFLVAMDSESDVLIVGAGAAGAAAAWRLAGHGFRVACLEQGGWVRPESSPSSDPDWEILRQGPWHPNPNLRRGSADYPVDDSESDIQPLLFEQALELRLNGGGTRVRMETLHGTVSIKRTGK